MVIQPDQKTEIQQATDIVALVGEHVSLRPKGRELLGLCPFHDDSNPSMHVSPAKQIYKCFSCGAGGDVFGFVMNYHKMTFPEALKYLADRAGIVLRPMKPYRGSGRPDGGQGDEPSERQLIAAANDRALRYFQSVLRGPGGEKARAYIGQRGISPQMVEAFQLGLAEEGWEGLTGQLQRQRVSSLELRGFELAGLITKRKEGNGFYDRFRGRLMFPICDDLGRPIAFGGRQLQGGDDGPKYLNSPESALFSKSSTLYGIHLAKRAIITSKTAVIVEGYTDVIGCHQAGFANVVATLGTALTRGHITALSRLCETVVLIFDADEAGHKAADRAVEAFLSGSVDIRVAVLPGTKDPADLFLAPDGAEVWRATLAGSADALDYKLQRMRAQFNETPSMAGQERLIQNYVRDLAAMKLSSLGPVRKALVVQRIAELSGLPVSTIETLLKQAQNAPPPYRPGVEPQAAAPAGAAKPVVTAGESMNGSIDAAQPAGGAGEGSAGPVSVPAVRRGPGVGVNPGAVTGGAGGVQTVVERHLLGALIRSGSVFHHRLATGQSLGQAIGPRDFSEPRLCQLAVLVWGELEQGRLLTLSGLLAELAYNEQHDLAGLATDVEAEVEAICGDQPEVLTQMVESEAGLILRRRAEAEYRQKRRALLGQGGVHPGEAAIDERDEATLVNEMMEHRRAHPSPARILRWDP